jgi:hypothetical protein
VLLIRSRLLSDPQPSLVSSRISGRLQWRLALSAFGLDHEIARKNMNKKRLVTERISDIAAEVLVNKGLLGKNPLFRHGDGYENCPS